MYEEYCVSCCWSSLTAMATFSCFDAFTCFKPSRIDAFTCFKPSRIDA